MGRQVNFFMMRPDEDRFVARVRECGGCIIPLRSDSADRQGLESLAPVRDWYDTEHCVLPPGRLSELTVNYYDTIRQYLVDQRASPVIQFQRCRQIGRALHRGRIWVELRYPVRVPEGIVLGGSKGGDLERLYQCLAGWIRRTFQRDPVFGFYAGQEALRFHAGGGELRQ